MDKANANQLLTDAMAQLEKQLHFTTIKERGWFLRQLSSSTEDLKLLCRALIGDFCSIYESCNSGRDKYIGFVLQWHQHCSSVLIEPTMQVVVRGRDERSSSKLWNKLTLGVEASTKNAVIICFCAAIFDLLLTQMRTLLSSASTVLSGDNSSAGKIALCPNPLLEQQVHPRQVSSRGVHTF